MNRFELIERCLDYTLTKPKAKNNKTAKFLKDIYDRLLSWYGDPNWWPGETPYEIIVGAILTQNTAWGNIYLLIQNCLMNIML